MIWTFKFVAKTSKHTGFCYTLEMLFGGLQSTYVNKKNKNFLTVKLCEQASADIIAMCKSCLFNPVYIYSFCRKILKCLCQFFVLWCLPLSPGTAIIKVITTARGGWEGTRFTLLLPPSSSASSSSLCPASFILPPYDTLSHGHHYAGIISICGLWIKQENIVW